MIDSLGSYCIDSNILMGETPKFVETIIDTQIPFGKNSKIAKNLNFDYVEEQRTNRKRTENLPPKIIQSAYSF